jgi:hypothetical protein
MRNANRNAMAGNALLIDREKPCKPAIAILQVLIEPDGKLTA